MNIFINLRTLTFQSFAAGSLFAPLVVGSKWVSGSTSHMTILHLFNMMIGQRLQSSEWRNTGREFYWTQIGCGTNCGRYCWEFICIYNIGVGNLDLETKITCCPWTCFFSRWRWVSRFARPILKVQSKFWKQLTRARPRTPSAVPRITVYSHRDGYCNTSAPTIFCSSKGIHCKQQNEHWVRIFWLQFIYVSPSFIRGFAARL